MECDRMSWNVMGWFVMVYGVMGSIECYAVILGGMWFCVVLCYGVVCSVIDLHLRCQPFLVLHPFLSCVWSEEVYNVKECYILLWNVMLCCRVSYSVTE